MISKRFGWQAMAQGAQARLFDDQPDMFGAGTPPAYSPDPDKIRRRLHKILAELRATKSAPLRPTRLSLYRTIFPQMTLFLSEEEGAQFRLDFDAELARLAAAPQA